ncbi:MAG TPA: CPBP family intramembrane metalloprotease [Thermoanaerobaculaceae bacterium]|nr:CPBP family intramembrane metalloprotease [Thermoanaerobaculaceae bacterium]HPS78239.1 CPBP family intramembrane metalloprotease [Thermoanaerobaculaceae bacterium]
MEQRLTPLRVGMFIAGIFSLWVAAWLVSGALGLEKATTYWLPAKALVWVVYPLLYWRASPGKQLVFIGWRQADMHCGLIWGVGAAVVWVALSLMTAPTQGRQHLALHITLTLVYSTLVTPILEETLFRGYIQSAIIGLGWRPWTAITVTSLLFVVLHFVGWSFQGVLPANALSVYPSILFALSLLLGFVRHRSGSLLASTTLHLVNNVTSTWLH